MLEGMTWYICSHPVSLAGSIETAQAECATEMLGSPYHRVTDNDALLNSTDIVSIWAPPLPDLYIIPLPDCRTILLRPLVDQEVLNVSVEDAHHGSPEYSRCRLRDSD